MARPRYAAREIMEVAFESRARANGRTLVRKSRR